MIFFSSLITELLDQHLLASRRVVSQNCGRMNLDDIYRGSSLSLSCYSWGNWASRGRELPWAAQGGTGKVDRCPGDHFHPVSVKCQSRVKTYPWSIRFKHSAVRGQRTSFKLRFSCFAAGKSILEGQVMVGKERLLYSGSHDLGTQGTNLLKTIFPI